MCKCCLIPPLFAPVLVLWWHFFVTLSAYPHAIVFTIECFCSSKGRKLEHAKIHPSPCILNSPNSFHEPFPLWPSLKSNKFQLQIAYATQPLDLHMTKNDMAMWEQNAVVDPTFGLLQISICWRKIIGQQCQIEYSQCDCNSFSLSQPSCLYYLQRSQITEIVADRPWA